MTKNSNLREVKLYSEEEKAQWWGEGPWVEEPDLVIFDYENFNCSVVRQLIWEGPNLDYAYGGYLCGYISFKSDQEFFDSDQIDVHGGITLDRFENNRRDLGFDCAHSGDFLPSLERLKIIHPEFKKLDKENEELLKKFKINTPILCKKIYRDIKFCINECISMCNQINEIHSISKNKQKTKREK